MLTDKHLMKEEASELGGVQRLYKFPSGYGLSAVNSHILHSYPFAWEIAVIKFASDTDWSLDYTTPLTSDVEVFSTDEEANAFIDKAITIL